MPSWPVVKTLIREATTFTRVPRLPEPDLVMDDPEKVAAFTRAGREDGVMAPVYLFHCAQVCEIVKPGDTVIDLGSGPATLLGMIARLNPETEFIGVDFSDEMIERAEAHVAELGLRNVRFQKCDITKLDFLADDSVDAAISTVSLHHLPDLPSLRRTIAEVARVLKSDGGLYLVDFGRLKSQKSIDQFAYQYADRQPELFTLDYLYSLQAAFTRDDFVRMVREYLPGQAEVFSPRIVPFMVAMKSKPRTKVEGDLLSQLQADRDALPDYHKVDLKDMIFGFQLGGLRSPALS